MSCFCCFWTRTFAHGPSRCSEVNTESLPCSSSWRPRQLRFSFYWLQNTCFQVIFKRDIGISSNMAFLQTQCCLCILTNSLPFALGEPPGITPSRAWRRLLTHTSPSLTALWQRLPLNGSAVRPRLSAGAPSWCAGGPRGQCCVPPRSRQLCGRHGGPPVGFGPLDVRAGG